jgi:phospholipid/cholesterol/gamma-HCH transport system substrate-binding protein
VKIAGEIKIGITGIITVIVIIWGINYLKGRNVLRSNYTLVATFQQVDGLESSGKVMLNGFKIGTVDKIEFKSQANIPFTVFLEIDKTYSIRANSLAEIYSADLLGSKALRIIQSTEAGFMENGDTLRSQVAGDMISSLLDQFSPLLDQANEVLQTLDSAGAAITVILSDPALKTLINNLDQATGSISDQLSERGNLARSFENFRLITEGLSAQNESIKNTISNLEGLTDKLNTAELDSLLLHLGRVSGNLAEITTSLDAGKGTMGKLINEDSLYFQIGRLIADLDSLVTDLNRNPKKYVSFSLIGR